MLPAIPTWQRPRETGRQVGRVSHLTATSPEEGPGSAAVAHVRGQGFAFPERRTLPSSSVCEYYDHLWWSRGRIDPAGAICVVGTAHDRRVLHDQARHDARLEDASARPADEGRRPAAIRWGSRSQAVSPSSPNGATPSRLNLDDPLRWEVSGGTETSHVPRGSKTSPGVVASETGSA